MSALKIEGNRFRMDGEPVDLWGIRAASGTMDDAQTGHLVAQFDDYLEHGINAVAVYYQGCSGGKYDPFSPDGKTLDAGHAARMRRIVEACDARGMVVAVGVFYQNASIGLANREAAFAAVRTAVASLKGYGNVIVNIANEQNSKNWGKHAHIIDLRETEEIVGLCRAAKEADPERLVGGGGYDHEKNIEIGLSDAADVLLFDTCGDEASGDLYRRFVAAGIDKPIVNVELFGGWTKTEMPGVFPEAMKSSYMREVEAAAAETGLSVFFHSNSWCQDQTNRYDLGGRGTEEEPGIRWYAEAVAGRKAEQGGKAGFG